MTLVQLAAFAGVIVAVGGASVVLQKGVRALRKFGRLLDGFLGDGTAKHPSVPDRLGAMEDNQTQFSVDQADLKTTVEELKATVAAHVDGDAPKWLEDGQAWGNRLDDQVAALGTRVSALEKQAPK